MIRPAGCWIRCIRASGQARTEQTKAAGRERSTFASKSFEHNPAPRIRLRMRGAAFTIAFVFWDFLLSEHPVRVYTRATQPVLPAVRPMTLLQVFPSAITFRSSQVLPEYAPWATVRWFCHSHALCTRFPGVRSEQWPYSCRGRYQRHARRRRSTGAGAQGGLLADSQR